MAQKKRHTPRPASNLSEVRLRPTAADEIAATVRGQLGRCAARALEQATLLEDIGGQLVEVVGELGRDAPERMLLQKACALRGLVLHGLGVLAELQSAAGHLSALASVRGAETAYRVEIGGAENGG